MNKWILGARPRTLPAAIAPVVVATALVGADFNWFRAALALKVAVWLQIGVNFANDYSDGVKGTDADRVGPIRLVASGLASARSVKAAALISHPCWNHLYRSSMGIYRRQKSLRIQRIRRVICISLLRSYRNDGYLLRSNRRANTFEFHCLYPYGCTLLCNSFNQQSPR